MKLSKLFSGVILIFSFLISYIFFGIEGNTINKEAVNPSLDSTFSYLISYSKEYYQKNSQLIFNWLYAGEYRRDENGNRMIQVAYTIKGENFELKNKKSFIKVAEENKKIIIIRDRITYCYLPVTDKEGIMNSFLCSITDIFPDEKYIKQGQVK